MARPSLVSIMDVTAPDSASFRASFVRGMGSKRVLRTVFTYWLFRLKSLKSGSCRACISCNTDKVTWFCSTPKKELAFFYPAQCCPCNCQFCMGIKIASDNCSSAEFGTCLHTFCKFFDKSNFGICRHADCHKKPCRFCTHGCNITQVYGCRHPAHLPGCHFFWKIRGSVQHICSNNQAVFAFQVKDGTVI